MAGFSNFESVQRQLEDIADALDGAIREALDQEADLIARLSQENTPVDLGDLRDSTLTYDAESDGAGHHVAAVSVGAGLDDPVKAIAVHERLDLRHASPTGAKFLQRSADELSSTMGERMARVIDSELKRRLR